MRKYPGSIQMNELIEEFERLDKLEDITPQRRGQVFNGFVSRLLNAWDIEARTNITEGTGEIDVVFKIDNTRFILEAKWEAKKINEDPISKLRTRCQQRLAGTIGILLAMEGFTDPAIRDMTRGQRLEILLIKREHLEALL